MRGVWFVECFWNECYLLKELEFDGNGICRKHDTANIFNVDYFYIFKRCFCHLFFI